MTCYIGTSGWTYDHWKNIFYPEKLPKNKWFSFYIRKFSAIEVNATFYRKFKDSTFLKWRDEAPDHFKFVLKVPKYITHQRYLHNTEKDISDFCNQALLLRKKLGALLLQLPPGLHFNPGLLKQTFTLFNSKIKVAVEFRNKEWDNDETYLLLKQNHIIYCNPDSPKSVLKDWVIEPTSYLRLHGRKSWYSYNYLKNELTEIANLLQQYKNRGIKNCYVFFNNDYQGNAPRNALELSEILADKGI